MLIGYIRLAYFKYAILFFIVLLLGGFSNTLLGQITTDIDSLKIDSTSSDNDITVQPNTKKPLDSALMAQQLVDSDYSEDDKGNREIGLNWVPIIISCLALFATIIISWSNYVKTQHETRPIISALIDEDGKTIKTPLMIAVHNRSKTDAEGIVYLEITYGDNKINCPDRAYYGGKVWNFPAEQRINGSLPLIDFMPEGMELNDVSISIVFKIFYRKWKRKRKLFKIGKIYDAPTQKWDFTNDKNIWIPVIAFSKSLEMESRRDFKSTFKKYGM